jgi:hypothetical protein
MTDESKNNVKVVAGSTFPVFTFAALVLLILKFSAYPTISWGLIIGVWLFPLAIAIAFFGVFLTIALFMLIASIIIK